MKKAPIIASFLLCLLALSSCGTSSFEYEPHLFDDLVSGSFESQDGDGYQKAAAFLSLALNGKTVSSFDDVFDDRQGEPGYSWRLRLPSTGSPKILVIPVDFTDYRAVDHLSVSSVGASPIELLKAAFFGEDAENQYYSVASYFDKASYGRLHLGGAVASDWFTYQAKTYAELSSSGSSALLPIREAALAWYAAAYPEDPLSNYYFQSATSAVPNPVALYLVYAAPTSSRCGGDSNCTLDRNSFFWAYTINNPCPTSWSSFDLANYSDGRVDSHTYIHEMGHIMGLSDYYDSVGSLGVCAPTGRMDMMDYSLGDETPLSKMLLGWTTPMVVTASCTVSLRPFSGSGDLILLAPDYNGTPYGEYLAISLYSPGYLNYVDSTQRKSGERLFGKTGLCVYHIDARLGFFQGKNETSSGYVSASTDLSASRLAIANKNSAALKSDGATIDASSILYQLLDKGSGSAALAKNYIADDDSLFYLGDGFSSSSFADFSFHDGAALGYSFSVSYLSASSARVDFVKTA